ncbi:MAG: hypothetical protein RLZZ241_588 [Bacteroidota bacterium]|jgi:hypothetical protein
MIRPAILFLKFVLLLLAIGVLCFLIWEPQVEGRNIGKDWIEIYFQDPFLAFVYLGSIPFFAGVYKGYQILGWIRAGSHSTPKVQKALRSISKFTLLTMGLAFIGQVYILINESDDRVGGIAMGMLIHFFSAIVLAISVVLNEILKQENPEEPLS